MQWDYKNNDLYFEWHNNNITGAIKCTVHIGILKI